MSPSFRLAGRALVAATLIAVVAAPPPAVAAKSTRSRTTAPAAPTAEEHTLSNGMKLVLVPRHLSPTVAGGWVAHVGSANEWPGITGLSHLFEHMMFKGSHVIGTRDLDKDLRLIDEQERVRDEMRAEESKLRDAQRRGAIADMGAQEAKTPRYRALEARFDSLVKEQRANMIKNEFGTILQKNGATFINANTSPDRTFYFETVPANKLELWFWMESDRLKNRVFREFYSERDVVYEERRRSYESTPLGRFRQAFESVFWEASPYAWPTIGWPSDIAHVTKAQADEYYALFYAPQNITTILVGDFDPKQALALAERYMGSIPAGTKPTPEMITSETKQLAEKRFIAEAETNPAVTMRWHTVAFTHRDVPALEVVEGLMNGATGRLRRNLVLGTGLAASAGAYQESEKYEGYFEVEAEAKTGHTPEEVEIAVQAEIDRLRDEKVAAEELQSVKNRYLANTYRALGSNFSVLNRYAEAEARGTWRDADRIDREILAVTADDVQRVARTFFTKENRAVALWKRKGETTASATPAVGAQP